MKSRDKSKKKPSERDIDQVVVAQGSDDAAWEKPVRVRRTRPASLSIPADLVARAIFLSQLHRSGSVDQWLTNVIRERVELEEAAFLGVKQELSARAP